MKSRTAIPDYSQVCEHLHEMAQQLCRQLTGNGCIEMNANAEDRVFQFLYDAFQRGCEWKGHANV